MVARSAESRVFLREERVKFKLTTLPNKSPGKLCFESVEEGK